ncbi:hypothetical protein P3T73_06915 [Kiritimatiellota bacterium B12222]|nr:hypothetical protein P3T73_06915 [Kiritimatiellota bacterium B12222]
MKSIYASLLLITVGAIELKLIADSEITNSVAEDSSGSGDPKKVDVDESTGLRFPELNFELQEIPESCVQIKPADAGSDANLAFAHTLSGTKIHIYAEQDPSIRKFNADDIIAMRKKWVLQKDSKAKITTEKECIIADLSGKEFQASFGIILPIDTHFGIKVLIYKDFAYQIVVVSNNKDTCSKLLNEFSKSFKLLKIRPE